MSKENVRLFYEALKQDKTLQEKFRLIGKKYEGQKQDKKQLDTICQNEIIPFAKAAGFEFSIEDMKGYADNTNNIFKTGDLSYDELDAVSGGYVVAAEPKQGGGLFL